ncbi:Centriolar coiled-coil protein [Merluccius polli]|uniref:Centriolar coiled-coil protein n=1 Tax=Merluccius polli TaxID=89951 RepID=A0AA47MJJ0_MERPO|nr:Centriolar coiled-coil protein [Merluccius polli]
MESYEEFALRNLALLREEGRTEGMEGETQCSLKDLSAILFYGRAVLPPLLTVEQRRDMRDYRQRAVQAHADRQNQRKNSVLVRVQNILDLGVRQIHNNKEPSVKQEERFPPHPKCPSPKQETVNGYTLVTDSPGLLRDSGCAHEESVLPAAPCAEPRPCVPKIDWVQAELEHQEKSEDDKEEEEEEEEEEDISLDSLLKRSREYVEKEQGRRESAVVARTPPPPPESLSNDKENDARLPARDSGVEFGFSLRHSPVGAPCGPVGPQGAAGLDPRRSGCLSPSLPDPHASQRLAGPESILVHPTHRRKPRPVSAGNLHISFPMGQADLIPRSPGGLAEARGAAAWGEAPSAGTRSADHWGLAGVCGGGGRRSSRCDDSPVREMCSPGRSAALSPLGHREHPASGFRRRCHTLDSQLYPEPGVDRSQERLPRFMAGVTRLPLGRRTPAATPLNQSYDVENPSPGPLRPHVSPDGCTQGQVRSLESGGPQGPEARTNKTVLRNAPESRECNTEETQWRMQALEDMQKRLEEEHVLQMSLLLAEQEKEQEHLQQELEEKERRLMGQGCDRPLSGNGLPSPSPSNLSSPSIHSPVYLWGPTWGASKPRARLSQVLTAEQQESLCRLSAVARGFLTRRLLDTEKVKHLRQTVGDTHEFIRSFQSEGAPKRGSVSPQDISLQDRLRAALYDIHDIFFEMPLEDRLALLQQDRQLRAERKLREMEKAKSPKDRVALSAATQRSMDRKKRVVESPAQARKTSQKAKCSSTNR